MHSILRRLIGGDLRSTGQADEVADQLLLNKNLIPIVVGGLYENDPVIRGRSADALEKVCRKDPSLLQPFKREFLSKAPKIDQQEVKWHVAQILGELRLTRREKRVALVFLKKWVGDTEKSKIVRVMAMQAMANFVYEDISLAKGIVPLLKHEIERGSGAIASRGRRIVKELKGVGIRI